MKTKLIFWIEQAIDLLDQCGYHDKSSWFQDKLLVLLQEDIRSNNFQDTISEMKDFIGGMGSFSDLSMLPTPDAKISLEEARELQWKISEELFDEIVSLLKSS